MRSHWSIWTIHLNGWICIFGALVEEFPTVCISAFSTVYVYTYYACVCVYVVLCTYVCVGTRLHAYVWYTSKYGCSSWFSFLDLFFHENMCQRLPFSSNLNFHRLSIPLQDIEAGRYLALTITARKKTKQCSLPYITCKLLMTWHL